MSPFSTLRSVFDALRSLDRKVGRALAARGRIDVSAPPQLPPAVYTQFAEETSSQLFDDIFGAIVRREHVLLIGPRGSGKSYAGRRAIRMAEVLNRDGVKDPAQSVLVPGAQVIAQGNKELPRDYFFEPEFEFVKTGDAVNPLTMELRQPPLMRHAAIDTTGRVKLVKVVTEPDKDLDAVTRFRATFSMKGEKRGDPVRPIEHFVLFLDEINRFNDGVLDTLLLLLEERCVIYQGHLVEMPVSVVATMNPPGYDISARSLSPPLLSRFNTVKTLYTAGPHTLVDEILPNALKLSGDELRRVRFEVFAVAIVLFWGEYDSRRPSGAYLSPDARTMIESVKRASTATLREGLLYVSQKSNYGPDARGTRDWIAATRRRLVSSGFDLVTFDADRNAEDNKALSAAAVRELGTAIANKLVLNFSPEARPDEFRKLLEVLSTMTSELFLNSNLRGVTAQALKTSTAALTPPPQKAE
jgi:MoxR-like ATPase